MSLLSDDAGGSRATTLVYLLVATVLIYAALKVVPVYMDFYAMDDEVTQQLHLSLINPADVIQNDIYLKAQELELPIGREDIVLSYAEGDRLNIKVAWVSRVDFGYGIVHDFNFVINSARKDKAELDLN